MRLIRRTHRAWEERPISVTLPLALIPVGIVALILGDDVSRAFTDIGGSVIIRCMGAAMFGGGILVVIGIHRSDPLYEVLGFTLAALGTAIYGTGVLLGLGLMGVVAGLTNIGIAVAFVGRVHLLLKAANRYRHGPRE